MAKYKNNSQSYNDWIKGHSKKELIDLIIGDDATPPLVTRHEPKITRPQLLWAMSKLNKEDKGGLDFDDIENFVDKILNIIEGFKWDKFYQYDYVRFDVKKPSLYVFLILIGMGIFGIIKVIF